MEQEFNSDLIYYYQKRALEYELIYFKPERQADIAKSKILLQQFFRQKEILEVACGTGFWTESIALTATSVLATDINDSVLEIARQKKFHGVQPVFKVSDIYQFKPTQPSEALFAGFILSHIEMKQIYYFLECLRSFVRPGGTMVLMDNLYVEGSSLPVMETDAEGNTFQLRKLADGSSHRVLKNFPSQEFLYEKVKGFASRVNYIQLRYFWILEVSL